MLAYAKILTLLPFRKPEAPARSCERLLAEGLQIFEQTLRKQRVQAKAAAATGTGPQTWYADWFENELDVGEEALALTETWSWQNVQTLQEALDWALASPQGQRAQARQEEENTPWNATLEMIKDLQLGLTWRSHTLLTQQAKVLGYSSEQLGSLQEALEECPCPETDEKEA